MQRSNYRKRRCARGSAYLIAILALTLFSTLALAFASFTTMNLRQGDNGRNSADALLAAESGLEYMLLELQHTRLPGTTNATNFVDNMHAALGARLDGSPNLNGQMISKTADSVIVPPISTMDGEFSAALNWTSDNRVRLVVTGVNVAVERRIELLMGVESRRPAVFDYGLASRGPISIYGNARIIGVNDPSEANVLSATESSTTAIHVDGSAEISGDLSVSGSGTTVTISGSPTIAGSKDPSVWADHVHFGVEAPDFPETNTESLAPLATVTIDGTTDINKDLVLNNVRIKAGTNPVFSNKVVLNGIVYVEAPNIVKFEGQTVLNGFIVTEKSDEPIENNQLHFAGNVESYGVEALPDTAEFADVKQMPGTFVCAPDFGVTFAGNFSTINGSVAADQLTFTGTASGTVKGSVVGLSDRPTDLGGTVDIFVDRAGAVQNPPGFVDSFILEPLDQSYRELVGG
jgi:hypothetical protein